MRLRQPHEATEHLQRVLKIRQAKLAKDDPRLADAWYELAWCHTNFADYEKAEDGFRRCLKIYQRDPSHLPQLAATQNGMAVLYENMGRYEEKQTRRFCQY